MVLPSRDEFAALLASRSAVPVSTEILADVETPLSAYWKLAHDQTGSFLLESVTGGEQLARYSFIGVRPKATVRGTGESLEAIRDLPYLDQELAQNLPIFVGGAVGFVTYDFVRTIEKLPDSNPDPLGLADVHLLVVESVLVFDHAKNKIVVVCLAADYDHALREIAWITERLKGPLPALPSGTFAAGTPVANQTQQEFESTVRRIKDYIVAGDCFQCVPSVRFSVPLQAHPLTVYRALRSLNPSPYMYLLSFDDVQVVGASPEALVSLRSGTATVRPIAGTRARADDPERDRALAEELLQDEKERAEHIMLVDLGRNDLGRVCEYGTVRVDELMVIEKYSHVMHIVSSVSGRLRQGLVGLDLLRACFPAGTLSGAPKVRAMQIIDELEPVRRGLYAGAVGYFSSTGDLDLAIAIRTILIKDGQAHVQAGAGIVFDSDPTAEWEECGNKAQACLRAIEMAEAGL